MGREDHEEFVVKGPGHLKTEAKISEDLLQRVEKELSGKAGPGHTQSATQPEPGGQADHHTGEEEQRRVRAECGDRGKEHSQRAATIALQADTVHVDTPVEQAIGGG